MQDVRRKAAVSGHGNKGSHGAGFQLCTGACVRLPPKPHSLGVNTCLMPSLQEAKHEVKLALNNTPLLCCNIIERHTKIQPAGSIM